MSKRKIRKRRHRADFVTPAKILTKPIKKKKVPRLVPLAARRVRRASYFRSGSRMGWEEWNKTLEHQRTAENERLSK